METVFLGTALLGAIVFIARYLRKTLKKGESCQGCRTGASKCKTDFKLNG